MLKTTVIGYIGQTAETRTLQDGSTATSFSVAHTERYTTREGELKDKTTWLNCTMWNAGGVKDWLKQSTQVYVEGFPMIRTYEREQGGTGISFDLRVMSVQLLNNPKKDEATAAAGTGEGTDGAAAQGTENADAATA